MHRTGHAVYVREASSLKWVSVAQHLIVFLEVVDVVLSYYPDKVPIVGGCPDVALPNSNVLLGIDEWKSASLEHMRQHMP